MIVHLHHFGTNIKPSRFSCWNMTAVIHKFPIIFFYNDFALLFNNSSFLKLTKFRIQKWIQCTSFTLLQYLLYCKKISSIKWESYSMLDLWLLSQMRFRFCCGNFGTCGTTNGFRYELSSFNQLVNVNTLSKKRKEWIFSNWKQSLMGAFYLHA